MNVIQVSVVIPISRDHFFIKKILSSIKNSLLYYKQSQPENNFIVQAILVTDHNNQKINNIFKDFKPTFELEILHSEINNTSYKRNFATLHAKHEWLLFFDDDIELDLLYFVNLKNVLNEDGYEVIQGNPILCSNKQRLLARLEEIAYEERIKNYLNNNTIKLVDARNVVIKRNIFMKYLFDENFNCGGEGTEFAIRLAINDVKILYRPELIVYHRNREHMLDIFKQKIRHAKGRYLIIKKYPDSYIAEVYSKKKLKQYFFNPIRKWFLKEKNYTLIFLVYLVSSNLFFLLSIYFFNFYGKLSFLNGFKKND